MSRGLKMVKGGGGDGDEPRDVPHRRKPWIFEDSEGQVIQEIPHEGDCAGSLCPACGCCGHCDHDCDCTDEECGCGLVE